MAESETSKQQYLVQPDYLADRKADYKKAERLNKKFTPIKESNLMLNGNVGCELFFNLKTKKFEFFTHGEEGRPNRWPSRGEELTHESIYRVISSALAMYRTICMFESPIVQSHGFNGYKVPWSISFMHNKSKQVLMVSEWKGAFGIWTAHSRHSELDPDFKKDILLYLNLLVSDKSPHPYDGVTAGSVA